MEVANASLLVVGECDARLSSRVEALLDAGEVVIVLIEDKANRFRIPSRGTMVHRARATEPRLPWGCPFFPKG